ncbi:RagB/SusD family nutrient uptake outer membrane protein [Paraflavitalea soli]|nr:RagB/SusD family nutrient uptake outer membrane protein [Paraflavitalea soli]
MTLSINKSFFYLLIITGLMSSSCEKYLDVKPVKTVVVPTKLKDLQALMDNYDIINQKYPALLELPSDDYYISSTDWNAAWITERLNYVWDKDVTYLASYKYVYQIVNFANVVLDELESGKFDQFKSDPEYQNIKGQALFCRSFAFYHLAQLYCKPYGPTAGDDLGIILRIVPDIEQKSVRSTVKQTYDQIIGDLKMAIELLPSTALAKSRPNKAAANGALARTYLSMRDYENAGKYADACLKENGALMDYNQLDINAFPPIERFNVETVYYCYMDYISLFFDPSGKIDTTLYASYDAKDLRKSIFFFENGDGTQSYKGSYDGTSYYGTLFNGIATDEMYLIRAESYARAGNTAAALTDLNKLLEKRWKKNEFTPVNAGSPTAALDLILEHRRKELVFRGLRWTDIRRLNLEGRNITLKRIIDGTSYVLPPNDLRAVMLFPQEVIDLSGISQNPR